MAENIRDIALRILTEISEEDTMSHIAIRAALEKYQYLPKRDRAFITRLCEGTTERRIELDYVIDQYATVPTEKMKPLIRDILRSAVYQILYMDSIPDAAAVNEAVRLTQLRGFYSLKSFVNGVLRSIIRHRDEIPYPDAKEEKSAYLSVTYSMPAWLVEEWREDFGDYITERMLASFLEERPVIVRYKTNRIQAKTITDSLISQGVTVRKASYLPYNYAISDFNYLPALTAFQSGWIFPQDTSSMLVAEVASPRKGDYVIDMCASPGGKSLHIADKMESFGMVEARDLTEDKVERIRENVRRADLINVRPVVMDALTYDPDSEERADIVLCDVPCSGLGVISRKSDIKYRITPERLDSLVDLQRGILKNAAAYVRPGGHLIFSTCTITRRENLDNIEWFTSHFPFELESMDDVLPRELRRLTTEEGYLQLIPGVHDTDGFFIARLKKKVL